MYFQLVIVNTWHNRVNMKSCIVAFLCLLCTDIYVAKGDDPAGHMQPLGSHMPPKEVEIRDTVPDPVEFFNQYVKPGKPVIFRGAAEIIPGYTMWKDDQYLKSQYGEWLIHPEIGKKEDRDRGEKDMKFSKFIDTYKDDDIFLVEDVMNPNPMTKEISLLKCMMCGGYKDHISTVIMWFSSGGTKSVLHNDDLENINCLFDGTKDFVMFDRKHKDLVPIDPEKGYSALDVEEVDMYKYETLQNLPWYHAKMNTGDCMYIPLRWYHHVHSSNTRNMAVNVWWRYMHHLTNMDDCPQNLTKLPDQRPVSDFNVASTAVLSRSRILEFFLDTDILSKREFLLALTAGREVRASEAKILYLAIDANRDGFASVEEVDALSDETILSVYSEESEISPQYNVKEPEVADNREEL